MILLDTHVLLWLVAGSDQLGERARRTIQTAWVERTVSVSSFTFWEIAMLHLAGRIDLGLPPRALHRRLFSDGLRTSPVDDETALRSVELGADGFHADPADRIIAATAILGGHQLATTDRRITDWARKTGLVAILDPTL